MKRLMYAAGILLLLLFLLCFPKEAIDAAREGMGLWLNTLIPTLLPFLILTGVLIRTGAADGLLKPLRPVWNHVFGISSSGAYALLLGLLCGYPMGAKLSSDLYGCGRISKREAEYLLTFTSHASPVFLNTYLLQFCLEGKISSARVYGVLLASAALTMVFFRFVVYRNRTRTPEASDRPADTHNPKKEPFPPGSLGTMLDASIMNGFETLTRLGGYILLFSILGACIRHYWAFGALSGNLLTGSMELTTGLHALAGSELSLSGRYLFSTVLNAFGGVCILAQTKSLLHRELSVLPYFLAKCLNALFAAVLILFF